MFYIEKLISVICEENVKPAHSRTRYGPALPSYELVYFPRADSVTHFNGKTMRNLPGTVEYLPKCAAADYYVDNPEKIPGGFYDIYFDTSYPMPPEADSFAVAGSAGIEVLFRKIYRLWIGRGKNYGLSCMALFYELAAEIAVGRERYAPAGVTEKIDPGVEYLLANCFGGEIDYYEPARLCGMSYTYFKQLFLQKYGMAPSRYVAELRLEHAVELLGTGRYSMAQIAEMCGFDSAAYFSRVFKKRYGEPPTRFFPSLRRAGGTESR